VGDAGSDAAAHPTEAHDEDAASGAGTPGSPAASADPAVQSDSESDPFSTRGNQIAFSDGRVEVRFGRKVQTVRPRLSLAAKYDLLAMAFPRMLVRLRIDAAGEVRKVDIVRSSGSASADQAVKVALYQWRVEPKRDRAGRAIGDVVEFPIVWR
jgi:TonB family protein